MPISTFSELRTAVQTWLDNTSIVGNIDDFIRMAEARHRREIRIREMLVTEPVVVNARTIPLPAGWLNAIRFLLLTDPVTEMVQIPDFEMARVRRSGAGRPSVFAVRDVIELNIAPDSLINGEWTYYKALTPLSGSAPTNALLARAPDVYLYGALLHTAPFIADDARLQTWETLYKLAVDGLIEEERQSRSIGPRASRVVGPTP